jgi:hypothetical protein
MLCASVVVLATAGCTLDSLFLSFTGSSNRKEQAVTISVDQVSTSLHAMLGKFGVKVEDRWNGEELHLKGLTTTGKKFEFIVQRQKTDFGERTVVAFEGDKEAESLLWSAAVIAVTNPAPAQQPQVQPAAGALPDVSGRANLEQIYGGVR